MRLIDAELLIDCINTVQEMALAIGGKLEAIEPVNEGFISLINSQPTVDAELVRHGKYIGTEFDGYADGCPVYYEWKCSECGCVFEEEEPTYNYCPNCGAKMDERKEE